MSGKIFLFSVCYYMFEIKEINDLIKAKKVWNALSPNESIYDSWDFRYAFYKYFNNPLHFFAGMLDGELIGLLPLQYNEEEGGYLEYFAEDFMEDNRLFIKNGREKYIPEFYDKLKDYPMDILIDDLAGDDPFTSALPLEDYKYVLALSGLKNFQDHLGKAFSSKRRRQFLKAKNEIAEKKILAELNDFTDIDLLFELNILRHGDESYLKLPHKREIFKNIAKEFDVRFFTYFIGGKKEAASYSVFYKGVYNYLSVGANLADYKNLGNYVGMENFDYAAGLGAKIFDAGLGDCGWKHHWHFDKIPQYSFYKVGGKIENKINQ